MQLTFPTGRLKTYSVAENKWRRLKDCPVRIAAPGFDYDSKDDVFVAIVKGATWLYSPAADEWTELAKDGVPISNWKTITYDPAHDVFVYQGGAWDKPTWKLFRYTPPKPAPTTATEN